MPKLQTLFQAAILPAITKAEWDAFSPKMKWDVIVTLRGPDALVGQDQIKYRTTAIIRARMMGIFPHIGGMVNNELHLVLTSRQTNLSAWNATHFYTHIEESAAILGLPWARIPPELHGEILLDAKGGLKHLWAHRDQFVPPRGQDVLRAWLKARGIEVESGEDAAVASASAAALPGLPPAYTWTSEALKQLNHTTPPSESL